MNSLTFNRNGINVVIGIAGLTTRLIIRHHNKKKTIWKEGK